MIIYVVGNEDYVIDYFVNKQNAEKAVIEGNELCEKYKNEPNVNTKPVYISEIETAD
jgi:hypothetical protein